MFGKTNTYVYGWDTKPKRTDPSIKPNVDLKLVYAPSYNGKNARNNIQFIDQSTIIFYVRDIFKNLISLTDFNNCSNHEYPYL